MSSTPTPGPPLARKRGQNFCATMSYLSAGAGASLIIPVPSEGAEGAGTGAEAAVMAADTAGLGRERSVGTIPSNMLRRGICAIGCSFILVIIPWRQVGGLDHS